MSDVLAAVRQVADPATLFGLRCADPRHAGHGYQTIYATSPNRAHVATLAESVNCYELVQSTDGGNTWTRAEP